MSLFWLAAAGLIVLAFALLWPALRQRREAPADAGQGNLGVLKDQLAALDAELAAGTLDAAQHRIARDEIAERLLEEDQLAASAVAAVPRGSKRGPLWLGLAVPLLAVGIYGVLGNRDALNPPAPLAAEAAPKFSPAEIEMMLSTLQKRLESDPSLPDALKGWTMLARSYAAMQRFPEARVAYGRAIAMSPNDAQLLADQADVIAMVQGQKTAGEPELLIAKALQLDPKNLKALALAGSAAYERKDFAGAIAQWSQARALAPADSDFVAGLDRSIADARAEGGLPDNAPKLASAAKPAASTATSAPAVPVAALSGRVTLSPALAAKVAPGDTLFVFARAAEGPRMPLAILKRPVSELPLTFKLDDSMAMSPEMTLSKFNSVIVVARISRSGSAMPAPGDLQGQTAALAPGAANIDLVIDGVQP